MYISAKPAGIVAVGMGVSLGVGDKVIVLVFVGKAVGDAVGSSDVGGVSSVAVALIEEGDCPENVQAANTIEKIMPIMKRWFRCEFIVWVLMFRQVQICWLSCSNVITLCRRSFTMNSPFLLCTLVVQRAEAF